MESDTLNTSRRSFLKKSAAAASVLTFPTIIPRHVLGGAGHTAPSDKVYIGMIGVGGRGRQLTREIVEMEDAQVVAITDPSEYLDLYEFYYRSLAGRGPVKAMVEADERYKAQKRTVNTYTDFREMLARETGLDGVVVGTPDHTHAYITATALRAGKHVYCEKPLTHNLWENEQIRQIARETGLATQMGNMGHSREGIRRSVEIVRSGVLGEIKETHSWSFATRFNRGLTGVPETGMPQPRGLDWDQWIGPRQPVPYHEVYSPVGWRDFWKFGTGALGDFGCHDLDDIVWALNLREPEYTEIFPGGFFIGQWNPHIIPHSEIGLFRFLEKGEQKAVDMKWYSGSLRPPTPEFMPADYSLPARGVMFVGERGLIQSDGAGGMPRVFPGELRREANAAPQTLPRSKGHMRDWIDAIKGGPQPSSNFEYATRLNEIVLTGVLSLRLGGRKVYWDSANLEAKGIPEAAEFIREDARPGWQI